MSVKISGNNNNRGVMNGDVSQEQQGLLPTSSLSRISEKLQIQVRYFDELMNCAKKIETLGLGRTRDDILRHEESMTEYERRIKDLHAKIILKEEQIERMRQEMIKSETKRASLTAQLAKTKVNAKREEVDRKFVLKNFEREKKESSKVVVDMQKKLIETEFKLHGVNDELKSVKEQLETSLGEANALRERLSSSEKDLISQRESSLMIEKQYEMSRRRELDDRKMREKDISEARDRIAELERELGSFKSSHASKLKRQWEESKECDELERKLVLSTQNIAKEQKLRAKVESERDEFREKVMYWQKQAQESLASTNYQIRRRDNAIAVLESELQALRQKSNLEKDRASRDEEEKKRLSVIIENQQTEFQSERESLHGQIGVLRQEIESLTTSLSASNRALEAMRRRNKRSTNSKDEAADLVRSQLEEWEQERKNLSSCIISRNDDDIEPVSFHDHDQHDSHFCDEEPQQHQSLNEMVQEAQKIERRIRRKHDNKKKKKKVVMKPSPYAA